VRRFAHTSFSLLLEAEYIRKVIIMDQQKITQELFERSKKGIFLGNWQKTKKLGGKQLFQELGIRKAD